MKIDFLRSVDPMFPDNALLGMTSMIDIMYPQMENLEQNFLQSLGETHFICKIFSDTDCSPYLAYRLTSF